LFVAQLLLVWEDLPFAATALAVVLATRFAAYRRRLNDALYTSFHEGVFLASDLDIYDITWYAVWHEEHHVIYASEGFAFGSNTRDLNIL
jgi:hypothetical protein